MSRRRLVAFVPALALVLASALSASSQPDRVRRVGFLPSASAAPTAATPSPTLDALRQRLAELGHVEGRTLVFEPRWAEGSVARLPELATELAGANLDVIVTLGAVATQAARNATASIPIVFAVVVDPVEAGLVRERERPGGNLTGFTSFSPEELRPHLAILKGAVPHLTRVAFLGDAAVAGEGARAWDERQAAAAGLQPQSLRVRGTEADIESAFASARREGAQAVVVLEMPAMIQQRRRIAETAIRHRLPTLFVGAYADAGGLLSYGISTRETGRRLAEYVDAVLDGTPPGTLPVERLVQHELIVNVRTARAIGFTVPPAVLQRADRVLE
jgi:putative tryptophan/tyrosine transport system substrate-binding protein